MSVKTPAKPAIPPLPASVGSKAASSTASEHPRRRHLRRWKERRWFIAAAIVSLGIGIYLINQLFVFQGSILITSTDQTLTIWLDNRTVTPAATKNGLVIKSIAGRHTITLQNAAGQEEKAVVSVAAWRTVSYTPKILLPPTAAGDQLATTLGDASSAHRSTDGKYLHYLNAAGTVMWRYNYETRVKVALSDPVFKQPTAISFSQDDSSVVVRSQSGNWYLFLFRKDDFLNSYFQPLSDSRTLDLAFDPSHDRLGLIDHDPVTGKLNFSTVDASMQNRVFMTDLSTLSHPSFIWAPHGRSIVLLDDRSYNESNLYMYDIAQNILAPVPAVHNVVQAAYDNEGQHLLLEEARSDGTVWLWTYDIAGNTAQQVGQLVAPGLAAWQPDDTKIVAILKDGQTDASNYALTVIAPDGSQTPAGSITALPNLQSILPIASQQEIAVLADHALWLSKITNQPKR